MILRRLKVDAEEYLPALFNRAVITVPAYFDMSKKATQDRELLPVWKLLKSLMNHCGCAGIWTWRMEQVQNIWSMIWVEVVLMLL